MTARSWPGSYPQA